MAASPLASLHAQEVLVPMPQILSEASTLIKAKKLSDAVVLLEVVMTRMAGGEVPPAGVNRDQIESLAVSIYFELKDYMNVEKVAASFLKRTKTGALSGDVRFNLGLSLALQGRFSDAVPVFKALDDSKVYRNRARVYWARAAQQADMPAEAIEALTKILADSPRDAEWANSAITLISLHLKQKNLEAASKGLKLLRGNLEMVDNVAGLNLLSLQLGDLLLGAEDYTGALMAYRTVLPRAELIRKQTLRTDRMKERVAKLKQANRNSMDDLDAIKNNEDRIKATELALSQIALRNDYDATLFYRLGHTYLLRGGPWEAAIIFQRLLTEYPGAIEREQGHAELVRAYADTLRLDKMKAALNEFMRATPTSPLLPQTIYIAAQAAFDNERRDMQMEFLDVAIKNFPDSELDEHMRIMQTNGHFTAGDYEKARSTAGDHVQKYPKGLFTPDAFYLRAMAALVLGETQIAINEIDAYLERYPDGRFVPDARFRLAAGYYAMEQHEKAKILLATWLLDYPEDHAQRGEVLSTQGDVFVALDKIDDAIKSYRAALKLQLPDELLGYVLDEVTKHYQAKNDFGSAATMWEEFARDNPDHPFVINAAFWVGKLLSREGKYDEALVKMGEIARRYVADPARDSVEQLLTQMSAILARNPKMGADGVRPPALTDEEVLAQINKELVTDLNKESPTVKARVLFIEAEVASLRKNTAKAEQLMSRIGTEFAPAALSAGLLGGVGDRLFADGKHELAKACYNQLVSVYPKSNYADFGYVGLGELAYNAGDYAAALTHFTNAIERAGARYKLQEATVGQAKTHLVLGHVDKAKELFEQIASNRAWRGTATAQSIYSLGEILFKRGGPEDLAQAQAYFQRVFISYKKFSPWVVKAYLRSGQTFEKLGQLREAYNTYNEMKQKKSLVDFPEYKTGLDRLDILEKTLPPEPPPAPVPAAPVASNQGGAL